MANVLLLLFVYILPDGCCLLLRSGGWEEQREQCREFRERQAVLTDRFGQWRRNQGEWIRPCEGGDDLARGSCTLNFFRAEGRRMRGAKAIIEMTSARLEAVVFDPSPPGKSNAERPPARVETVVKKSIVIIATANKTQHPPRSSRIISNHHHGPG
jgi:hypothetical protein